MTAITHHVPANLLAAYAMGTLPQSFGLVVATHISMCADCRAEFEAHSAAGGVVLEDCAHVQVSHTLKTNLLDALDAPYTAAPVHKRSGIFPGPTMAALKGKPPKWTSIGMGVRQSIMQSDKTGSARLLYIPPGQAVPDHSHGGLELTLVLQGSFHDITGTFAAGDLEVADQSLEHTPIAGEGMACICLAATDAPLRFTTLMPRLLQPFFRI
jgi:putative transcriptional regulator